MGHAKGGGNGEVHQQVGQAAVHIQHPQCGQWQQWWQGRQDIGIIANANDSNNRELGALGWSIGSGGRVNHGKDNNGGTHKEGGNVCRLQQQ